MVEKRHSFELRRLILDLAIDPWSTSSYLHSLSSGEGIHQQKSIDYFYYLYSTVLDLALCIPIVRYHGILE